MVPGLLMLIVVWVEGLEWSLSPLQKQGRMPPWLRFEPGNLSEVSVGCLMSTLIASGLCGQSGDKR